jgi:uncharacterized protein (TIGR03382 family)
MKRTFKGVAVLAGGLGMLLAGGRGDGQAVTAGLVRHWSLDAIGSLTDAVAADPLTNNGGATATAGMFGNAVDLDGSNDSLTAADSAALDFGTGSFTVAVWVRPSNTNSARVINKWHSANAQGWLMDVHTTTGGTAAAGAVRFRIDPDGSGTQGVDLVAANALGSGTGWRHLAAVVDTAGDRITLYVNGTAVATTTTGVSALTAVDNDAPLSVGLIPTTTDKRLNGDVDEIRLYTSALTAAQVRTLVATAPPVLVDPPATGVFEVTLTWAAVPGATSYQPYISQTSGSGYVAVGAPVTGTSVTLGGLNPTPYFFVVTALNGVLPSLNSNQVTATPQLPVPRTKDHDEGTFDDNCSCGAAVPGPLPGAALAAFVLAVLGRRRRSSS